MGLSFKTLMVKRKTNNFILYDIKLEKLLRFKIPMKHGHLTIINVTYNINHLY